MLLVNYILIFCFVILGIYCEENAVNSKLIVTTTSGKIRGRKAFSVGLNLTYYAYQGIPYAEPPVGQLRFKPPVPKQKWEGTLDATKDGEKCVQSNPPEGSEDCLFINVYVPEVSKYNKDLLPTMVFIFGGGFEAGFSNYELYGPDYLLEKKVVIVTFNYRLGILGFLSTGDMVVPGNNGLKDQVLALKWVQDNIRRFGGDPDSVTIFGQSAGSASVSYLLQSKLARGLFHKAIMESGVSLSAWAFSRKIPEVIKKVAQDLKLEDTSSSEKIVEGLRQVNFTRLQSTAASTVAFQYLSNDPRNGFLLGPTIEPEHDNAFFTKKSHQLLESGDFAQVPCIVGFNSLEGTFNFGTLFKLYLLKNYDFNHARLLPFGLNIEESQKSKAAQYVKSHYFGKHLIAFSDRNLMKYLSDDLFVRPIREFVRLISKHVNVYFYTFAYEGGLWGYANRTQPGVAHSEELGYLWRSTFNPSEKDILTRKRMTAMWTDFAKTGNPTPDKYFTTSEVIWQPTDKNFTYLEISDKLTLKQFPEKSNMELWDEIYQVYGRPPYDTY